MAGYQMISNILSKNHARFKRRWVAAYMCFLFCTTSFSVIKVRMTSDLAEAEVVDSSDNFSQAAHRLCVSEPGSDVAPRHSGLRTHASTHAF